MTTCPRLIEVALPIREISAESVRDKSLRHGHISTLHLWWARRPLAASRAVVFASLVPDPDDPACPADFRKACEKLLKSNVPQILKHYDRGREQHRDSDPYKPYKGTEDTLRNRLLTFIAKWSPEYLEFEAGKRDREPEPKYLLDDRSLVKWETSDPDKPQGRAVLEVARELVKAAYGGKTPVVLDPFAGGGAIPLEAGRLGCQAIANDYNPVAYLILRATCEFPQKYGKPGTRRVVEEEFGKKVEREVEVPNVLVHDVEYWAHKVLEQAREKIGHLYPPGKDGMPVVGYIWARTAPCSNPQCRAEIPLLRSFLLCNKDKKKVALEMTVRGKKTEFGIVKGKAIKRTEGTMLNRGDCQCPVCSQVTLVKDLRRAGLEGKMGERMVAVITDTPKGKDYRPVENSDLRAFAKAARLAENVERPAEPILPEITGKDAKDTANSTGIRAHLYGYKTWGSLFNQRQLLAVQTFVSTLRTTLPRLRELFSQDDYRLAVMLYLGLWTSKLSVFLTTFGKLHSGRETLDTPFSEQAIPMKWDYPEVNPFSESAGGAAGLLEWTVRVLSREGGSGVPSSVVFEDGASLSWTQGQASLVVTDPPYFDSIAYADLSDFFYVWLKRELSSDYPDVLRTPLTPKGEEATALRHRHAGDWTKARKHFSTKLAACLAEARRVCRPDGVLSVMFAHQTTEAWSALVNALFGAGLTVRSTYPIETELKNRAVALGTSALESSITVTCRVRDSLAGPVSLKGIKIEVDGVVQESVHRFFDEYRFRGADLLVACYGPAVGVFGKYRRVEKADGSPVGVPELLELVKESALKTIAGEFTGDVLSRLYYVWANLYGTGEQAWDDAVKVVQVGGDSEDPMVVARGHGLLEVDGPKCRLALLADRQKRAHLGEDEDAPLIDQLHRAMLLWKRESRAQLVEYLRERGLAEQGPFWKLAQALFEVLPRDTEDWKLVSALLGEREALRTETKRGRRREGELEFGG